MPEEELLNLPWHLNAYLLLDGISVESLPRKLYEWSESPDVEVLYLDTPWAELNDVSPHLIKLEDQRDPVLARFLENKEKEWGYLLFSSKDSNAVVTHLRKLISVEHPLGETMLLRLADPCVADALFALSAANNQSGLFGPIEQIGLYDSIKLAWRSHCRSCAETSLNKLPYRLSNVELASLGEVDFRKTVTWLTGHMHTYFPRFMSAIPEPAQRARIYDLASQAYQAGFTSERDIGLYANVFGFLGEDVLDQHPDIAALLTNSTPQTPSQRIEQAAALAESRLALSERNSA